MSEVSSVVPVRSTIEGINRLEDQTGREQELKFTLDETAFKAAQALPLFGSPAVGPSWRRLRTTYFDTELGDLRRNKITLRMRQVRGGYLMGLKRTPSSGRDFFERGELEVKVQSFQPEFTRFGRDVAASIAGIVGDRPLMPVFVSDIRRSTRSVKVGASTIEVAFDSGFIIAGERREPVREIELELKQGDPTALYRFGLAALDALPLSLGVLSKAARGWQLLSAEAPAPVRAKPPEIVPQTSVDEAIGILLRECLYQFTANWPAATSGSSMEAVHQMRVSMRRLRAAFGFFHRVFPCQDFEDFRAEAKRIATAMGQARDWDVFVELVRSGPLRQFGDTPGFASLLAASQLKANAGHAEALAVIREKLATLFVLSMEEFISRRGWRNAVADERLSEFAGRIAHFAVQCLERLDRKMRRRGRHFGSLAPEARHQLRITLKNVRYASEFFGHIFLPRSAVRRYTQRTAALQDTLGELNDAAIAARLIKQLDFTADTEIAFAAGLVSGWCERSAIGDGHASRAAWRSLQKSERYWRDHLDHPA
jgi:inorganic triphosphatase YgiF